MQGQNNGNVTLSFNIAQQPAESCSDRDAYYEMFSLEEELRAFANRNLPGKSSTLDDLLCHELQPKSAVASSSFNDIVRSIGWWHDRVLYQLTTFYLDETRWMWDSEEPIPNGKVLDYGCGKGNFSRVLADIGYDATGYDKDEDKIQAARILNHSNRPADRQRLIRPMIRGKRPTFVTSLPRDHKFDAAVLVNVLISSSDAESATILRQAKDLIPPHRCVIISDLYQPHQALSRPSDMQRSVLDYCALLEENGLFPDKIILHQEDWESRSEDGPKRYMPQFITIKAMSESRENKRISYSGPKAALGL